MECNFYVGQKVVCIALAWAEQIIYPDEMFPQKGVVYTVREIKIGPRGVGILLVELVNAPINSTSGFIEPFFAHQAFRPATDISIFTKMLNKAPIRESERV